jgi:DNA-binding response OmpR family regulator
MNPKQILVIDDQHDNVFILQDRLDIEGFKVLTAYDGPTGIEIAEENKPDLIILDIMMPKMDGFEVCERLTKQDSTKDIPIILLTALNNAEDTAKGFASGAFDFIKKPFNRTELLARIKAALRFSETKKLLIELEKINTFSATVRKTNHDIKQPLTLISLSATAIKREIESETFDKESVLRRVQYIENSVKEIVNVLEKMTKIQSPEVKKYLDNIRLEEFENEKLN